MRCTLLALAFVASSCASYGVTSGVVGPPVPALAASCNVAFSRARPQELTEGFEQVGVLCVAGDGWPAVAVAGRRSDIAREAAWAPGRAHEAVRRAACRLGGELVAPAGVCGRFGDLELGVWRPKP